MKITSCRNCEDRYLGCHDHCEKYLSQKRANEEARERERTSNLIDAEFAKMRTRQKVKRIKKKLNK